MTRANLVERLPLKAIQALEKLRISYNDVVGEQPLFAADQAVKRVVEVILRNTGMESMA